MGELAPSLRDLLGDPVYARARELGRARIRVAADDPTGATRVEELSRATPPERFLSFFYARLLLSAAPTMAPLRRWAVAEAKQGYGRWRSAPLPELVEVSRRLDRPVEPTEDGVRFELTDYVELATPVREGDFRLVRQGVRDGHVHVDRDRAARLLQEAVRIALSSPVEVTEEVGSTLRANERDFLEELATRMPPPPRPAVAGSGPIAPEKFPPCIRKMERMLQAGENLSHSGRFALAAFLHKVGADFETIVDTYRGAPDFDESVTRYQVEHITHRDGGEGYMPPECDTLRSHGLCFRDGDPTAPQAADRGRDLRCFDPALRHPLTYYRMRGGSVRPSRRPEGSDDTPSEPATPR